MWLFCNRFILKNLTVFLLKIKIVDWYWILQKDFDIYRWFWGNFTCLLLCCQILVYTVSSFYCNIESNALVYVIRSICFFVMAAGQLFSRTTQALFYNYKQLPIQRMLDFDFLCGVHHQFFDSRKLWSYINVFFFFF